MSDDSIDRTKLTFAQAEGYEAIPARLEKGTLDKRVRARLWDYIHSSLVESSRHKSGVGMCITPPWYGILRARHIETFHEPADLFDYRFTPVVENLRALFFDGEYWQVLHFLQQSMRAGREGLRFTKPIKNILEGCLTAYTVLGDVPTIIPISSPEEKETLERAFADIRGDKFAGARNHLIRSCEALNNDQSADSIRESIHAVEAIAKVLESGASKTLDPALKALAAEANIHAALQQGFSKIYGYTNDEKGIRHALLDDESNADEIDATFMLGACAAFVSYLINKSRKAGLA